MEAPISMTYTELESMLRPLIKQQMQDHQQTTGTSSQVQDSDLDPVFSSLHKLIPSSDEALTVPGIPLPEVDEQLGPLQQEVEAVLQRLSSYRKEVPAVMASALEQQLKELRPKDTVHRTATAEPASDAAGTDLDQSKQLEEAHKLHQTVKEAVDKLPALRARLEEMSVRLGRNLEAVGAEHATASQPPRTVERVLRGVAAGRGLGAAGASGSAEDDLQASPV